MALSESLRWVQVYFKIFVTAHPLVMRLCRLRRRFTSTYRKVRLRSLLRPPWPSPLIQAVSSYPALTKGRG